MGKLKDEVLRRLANTPSEYESLEAIIGTVFDVHRGIETTAKEDRALRTSVKPVQPVPRELIDAPDENGQATGPRKSDFVYDISIKEELEAMVRADPTILEQLRERADEWVREGLSRGSSKKVYVDISDGAIIQNHPELGVAADRSDGSVRLAFILYDDDLEVVNALGAFHGRHKLGMFYWALVNVDASVRMAFHNLHLATVALVSDIDYYGINQVVSGLPGDSSFGSSMTALHTGLDIASHRVKGWVVVVSADYPAAGLLTGFKKSVSASCFCRECDCDKREENYPLPHSFLDDNEDLASHYTLRELEEHQEQFAHYLTLGSKAARESYLASIGGRRDGGRRDGGRQGRLKGTCAGEAEQGALLDGGEQQCAVEAHIVRLHLAVERLEEQVLNGTGTSEKMGAPDAKRRAGIRPSRRGPSPRYNPDPILLIRAVRMENGDPGRYGGVIFCTFFFVLLVP